MSHFSFRPILTDRYFEGEPLKIGNEPQLLAGDTVVEDAYRVYREQQPAIRYQDKPVMYIDKPWEKFIQCPMIIFDEDDKKYKMWYSTRHQIGDSDDNWETNLETGNSNKMICYAESNDGIHWDKPYLDVYPFGEWKTNNIVAADCDVGNTIGNVFINPDKSDKDKKFVLIWNGRGVWISYSPDGKHWTNSHEITNTQMDCTLSFIFDTDRKTWMLICRPSIFAKHERERSEKNVMPNLNYRRRIAMMESKDLINWTTPRIIYSADENPIYTQADNMTFFTVGDHPIAFIHLFPARNMTECLEQHMVPFLAFGEDLYHLQMLPEAKPVIECGVDGTWDENMINIHGMPITLFGDETRTYFYYCGESRIKPGELGLVYFGKDRYVARKGDRYGGWLLTREFYFDGSSIEINADINPGGEIKVEILEGDNGNVRGGRVIEGYSMKECNTITEGGFNVPVKWNDNADLSSLNGKPVYIKFNIKNAKLYTFTVKE